MVFGRERLRELKSWDWGKRLVAAGIQRLELERRVTREEFDGFLQEVLARLMLSTVETSEARRCDRSAFASARWACTGSGSPRPLDAALAAADDDAGTHARRGGRDVQMAAAEVQSGGSVPLLEAEAVVRSLSVAMHGDSRMVLPLLKLKEFDQYTTTHSLNVAVLAMGLAESLGCRPKEIRAIGVAGLLARHRQDPHPARGADQARQAHRRRARDHELASR